jgi:DNA-binding GntR family transcriptional regulator
VTIVVDPYSPVPAYVQVANAIEALIKSKKLPHLAPIPSESSIQQEYGVARGTARHAVALLRERGLVFTIQGRGTYVGPPP